MPLQRSHQAYVVRPSTRHQKLADLCTLQAVGNRPRSPFRGGKRAHSPCAKAVSYFCHGIVTALSRQRFRILSEIGKAA